MMKANRESLFAMDGRMAVHGDIDMTRRYVWKYKDSNNTITVHENSFDEAIGAMRRIWQDYFAKRSLPLRGWVLIEPLAL